MLSWVLTLVLPAQAAPPMNAEQIKVIDSINATGPAIDACVNKYLTEYPSQRGHVMLAVSVNAEGKVASSKATTSLEGARNLRPCLEAVGKTWTFPPPKDKTADLNLKIGVMPGTRFRLRKPGDPPPEPKAEPKPEPGAVKLQPTGWGFLPGGW